VRDLREQFRWLFVKQVTLDEAAQGEEVGAIVHVKMGDYLVDARPTNRISLRLCESLNISAGSESRRFGWLL